jgi:hypothetical protein
MSFTPYLDTEYPSKYFEEYLSLIYKYRNIFRQSNFIKYYNLNIDKSIFNENTDSTYTPYTYTGLVYDVYEYTPTLYFGGIQNTETFEQDTIGKNFPAMTSVTVYTIDHPNVNDLIQLYSPYNKQEIFRVSGVRLQTGIINSPIQNKLKIFELDLEYAVINDIETLNINDVYVYDITLQKNLPVNEFQQRISSINSVLDISNSLNQYYNNLKDLYCADNYAPCYTNELLIEIKRKYNIDYNRIFECLYLPYFYDEHYERQYTLEELLQLDPDSDGYVYCYNLLTGELEQVDYPNDNYTALNNLIELTNQLRTACEPLL